MAQDVIVRGVTYTGVEKLSLPVSGGSALFRDTSDADASASDVLSGKKAYNANGEINGGMTNQGAVSGTISDKDTPFQIPQGYHNGSGSVEIAAAQKALLVPGNIRDSVTILGVTGDYTGGGGGPTSADAILIVTAPSGSTLTATKGGTTLSPTMWTTAADANFECALFIINSSLFDAQNAWTVTATKGTEAASDTVTVDSAKQYSVKLDYNIWLIRNGIFQSDFSFAINYGSFTEMQLGYARLYAGSESGNPTIIFSPAIDFDATPYRYLHADVESIYSWAGNSDTNKPKLGIGTNTNGGEVAKWVTFVNYPISNYVFSRQVVSVDLSAVTGTSYVKLFWNRTSSSRLDVYYYNLWLSNEAAT